VQGCGYCFLQKHWLGPDDLDLLNVNKDFVSYASSAMEAILARTILSGRPFGGVAILVRNNLSHRVKVIHMHERFIMLCIDSIILCNVYLPCRSSKLCDEVLADTLASIAELVCSYNKEIVILGGDLNVNLNCSGSICLRLCLICVHTYNSFALISLWLRMTG
jgi:hypothetical protein